MGQSTYDVTTNTGKVRLLINDKEITTAQFDDAEITFFLDEGGSVYGGAALALRAWAAALANTEQSVKLGAWSGDKGDVSRRMLLLADTYEAKRPSRPITFAHVRQDWSPRDQANREIAEDLG
jgi:hypothetical protein